MSSEELYRGPRLFTGSEDVSFIPELRTNPNAVLALPDAEQNYPLPIESLAGIDHVGFDIEQTVYDESPAQARAMIMHFAHWAGVRRSELQQPEPIALADSNAGSAKEMIDAALQRGSERQQKMQELRSRALEVISDPAELDRVIASYLYLTHDDKLRTKGLIAALGVTDKMFWQLMKEYWRTVAPEYVDRARLTDLHPAPGIGDFLKALHASGKKISFITNGGVTRTQPMLVKVLGKMGVEIPFTIISAGDMEAPKPQPDAFHAYFAQEGLEASPDFAGRVPYAYFGNNAKDVLGAHNANAAIAGLVNRMGVEMNRYQLPPHHQFRDFRALIPHLGQQS